MMAILIAMVSTGASACISAVELRSPERGSVQRPVICDSPAAQRGYLKRLRAADDLSRELAYEYLGAVRGPDDQPLDRFAVENPAPDERGFGDILFDLFRSEPVYPPAYVIHMSIYGQGEETSAASGGCELERVPGFPMLREGAERSK